MTTLVHVVVAWCQQQPACHHTAGVCPACQLSAVQLFAKAQHSADLQCSAACAQEQCLSAFDSKKHQDIVPVSVQFIPPHILLLLGRAMTRTMNVLKD